MDEEYDYFSGADGSNEWEDMLVKMQIALKMVSDVTQELEDLLCDEVENRDVPLIGFISMSEEDLEKIAEIDAADEDPTPDLRKLLSELEDKLNELGDE